MSWDETTVKNLTADDVVAEIMAKVDDSHFVMGKLGCGLCGCTGHHLQTYPTCTSWEDYEWMSNRIKSLQATIKELRKEG